MNGRHAEVVTLCGENVCSQYAMLVSMTYVCTSSASADAMSCMLCHSHTSGLGTGFHVKIVSCFSLVKMNQAYRLDVT